MNLFHLKRHILWILAFPLTGIIYLRHENTFISPMLFSAIYAILLGATLFDEETESSFLRFSQLLPISSFQFRLRSIFSGLLILFPTLTAMDFATHTELLSDSIKNQIPYLVLACLILFLSHRYLKIETKKSILLIIIIVSFSWFPHFSYSNLSVAVTIFLFTGVLGILLQNKLYTIALCLPFTIYYVKLIQNLYHSIYTSYLDLALCLIFICFLRFYETPCKKSWQKIITSTASITILFSAFILLSLIRCEDGSHARLLTKLRLVDHQWSAKLVHYQVQKKWMFFKKRFFYNDEVLGINKNAEGSHSPYRLSHEKSVFPFNTRLAISKSNAIPLNIHLLPNNSKLESMSIEKRDRLFLHEKVFFSLGMIPGPYPRMLIHDSSYSEDYYLMNPEDGKLLNSSEIIFADYPVYEEDGASLILGVLDFNKNKIVFYDFKTEKKISISYNLKNKKDYPSLFLSQNLYLNSKGILFGSGRIRNEEPSGDSSTQNYVFRSDLKSKNPELELTNTNATELTLSHHGKLLLFSIADMGKSLICNTFDPDLNEITSSSYQLSPAFEPKDKELIYPQMLWQPILHPKNDLILLKGAASNWSVIQSEEETNQNMQVSSFKEREQLLLIKDNSKEVILFPLPVYYYSVSESFHKIDGEPCIIIARLSPDQVIQKLFRLNLHTHELTEAADISLPGNKLYFESKGGL